jgi:ATP-dependent DNA ligase
VTSRASSTCCASNAGKCARKGRYNVRRLIEKYGRKATEADGPTVFAHACKMGLEGIVSKRKDSPYRSGRSPDWLKSKNPTCEA